MAINSRHDGQAIVLVVMLLPIFVLLAAVALDLYHLATARTWAYRAASAAAMRGVSQGRDWTAFYGSGYMRLDEGVAAGAAAETLAAELARRGLAASSVDIRVLPEGGSVSHYPPEGRADLWGSRSWSSSQPVVGVYAIVPVETSLLRLAGGGATDLHVFAAASVVQ